MFAASDTDFIVGCFKQKLMKEHKHLKQCHPGKSRQDNFVLPVERPEDRNLVKNTDRQRCKCEVIGCCYYGISVSRLDRHMRKVFFIIIIIEIHTLLAMLTTLLTIFMQLFTLITILLTYATYNNYTYTTCITYNTIRLLTLLTILILFTEW